MRSLIALLVALLMLPVTPLMSGDAGSILLAASADDAASPIPFASNGCTGFRDAEFFSCCFVHDFAYWSGGTWGERGRADASLRRCLIEISHDQPVADIAYALVRMTTLGGVMFDFGWGRGWRKGERGFYDPLTPAEQRAIQVERRRVCSELTPNPKSNRYYVDRTEPRDDIRQIRPNQARQLCGVDLPTPARLLAADPAG